MLPSQISFRKFIPHSDQPSNFRAGLSKTYWILQQQGELLMTTLLARAVRRDETAGSLTEKIWEWDFQGSRDVHHTSLVDRVEDAVSVLSAIYAVGETGREDLLHDLQLEEFHDLDKLAVSVIRELVERCARCPVPIIPHESLASLLAAASDAGLRGMTPALVLDMWEELRFPELAIIPSVIRWAASDNDNASRLKARRFGMKIIFEFLKNMVLDSGEERAEFPLWADKLCQIISEFNHCPNPIPNICDGLTK